MPGHRSGAAALAFALWLAPELAFGAVYPCPSDPGFCYRDFGDDGCFDSGVDDGPINTEIETISSFPPVPPAGTVVCPPRVKELSAAGADIRLSTASPSSILFYGTRIVDVRFFDTMSGGQLLVGGKVLGSRTSRLEAEGDITLEDGMLLGGGGDAGLIAMSQSGNITLGPKASFKVEDVSLQAPAGNITFLKSTSILARNGSDGNVRVIAGGVVEMVRPKIRSKPRPESAVSVVEIEGSTVIIRESSNIKSFANVAPQMVAIRATAGDVTIDRIALTTNTPIAISGENVTIGVTQNGRVPRSSIKQNDLDSVEILANDTIRIENLRLTSRGDVLIETQGPTADLLGSSLKGVKTTPTFEVSAGAGSTCDLTGTSVTNGTLVTNCDTVIGP